MSRVVTVTVSASMGTTIARRHSPLPPKRSTSVSNSRDLPLANTAWSWSRAKEWLVSTPSRLQACADDIADGRCQPLLHQSVGIDELPVDNLNAIANRSENRVGVTRGIEGRRIARGVPLLRVLRARSGARRKISSGVASTRRIRPTGPCHEGKIGKPYAQLNRRKVVYWSRRNDSSLEVQPLLDRIKPARVAAR